MEIDPLAEGIDWVPGDVIEYLDGATQGHPDARPRRRFVR
jgi:hypothetical protein